MKSKSSAKTDSGSDSEMASRPDSSPGFPEAMRRILGRIIPFMLSPKDGAKHMEEHRNMRIDSLQAIEEPAQPEGELAHPREGAIDERNHTFSSTSGLSKGQSPREYTDDSDIEITSTNYTGELNSSPAGMTMPKSPARSPSEPQAASEATKKTANDDTGAEILPHGVSEQRIPRKRKKFKSFKRNNKLVIINPSSESDDTRVSDVAHDATIKPMQIHGSTHAELKPESEQEVPANTVKPAASQPEITPTIVSPKRSNQAKSPHISTTRRAIESSRYEVHAAPLEEARHLANDDELDPSTAEYVVLGSSSFRTCEAKLLREVQEAEKRQLEILKKAWMDDNEDQGRALRELTAFFGRKDLVKDQSQKVPALVMEQTSSQKLDDVNQRILKELQAAFGGDMPEVPLPTSLRRLASKEPNGMDQNSESRHSIDEMGGKCISSRTTNTFVNPKERNARITISDSTNSHTDMLFSRTAISSYDALPLKIFDIPSQIWTTSMGNVAPTGKINSDDASAQANRRRLRNKKRRGGALRNDWRQKNKLGTTGVEASRSHMKSSPNLGNEEVARKAVDPVSFESVNFTTHDFSAPSSTKEARTQKSDKDQESNQVLNTHYIKDEPSPTLFCGSSESEMNQEQENLERDNTCKCAEFRVSNTKTVCNLPEIMNIVPPVMNVCMNSSQNLAAPGPPSASNNANFHQLKPCLQCSVGNRQNSEIISLSLGSSCGGSVVSISSVEVPKVKDTQIYLKQDTSPSQVYLDVALNDTIIPDSSQSIQASQKRNSGLSQIAVNSSQDFNVSNTIAVSSNPGKHGDESMVKEGENFEPEQALANKSFAELIREKFIEAGNQFDGFGIDPMNFDS